MDDLETCPETSSKGSNARNNANNSMENSELCERTESLLIKGHKSRDISKSVSFPFMEVNKEIRKKPNVNSNCESDSLKKTHSNTTSSESRIHSQPRNEANDIISQQILNLSNKSNEVENLSEIGKDFNSNCFGWDGYEAGLERASDPDARESIPQCVPPWASSVRETYGLSPQNSNKSNEVENLSETGKDFNSNCFGWDGYEAGFERASDPDARESIPQCVPPWATSMRETYGLSPQNSFSCENTNVQERIKNLMSKYNDLMLVKRIESKKQITVEQGLHDNDINAVKARTKNTRYYVAPLSNNVKTHEEVEGNKSYSSINLSSSFQSDNMSLTKKTSRTKAKNEIRKIIQPTTKHVLECDYDSTETKTKDQRKCQKLTLSNIRDYVNAQSMTPEQRKLHEIIKIETVPSKNREMKDKAQSKYIINVPQNKSSNGTTVNVIKIKEKRKLRVHSIEDIREQTTELRYSEGTSQKQQKAALNALSHQEKKDKTISKTFNSPTETKTFQVTSKTTPLIAPFVDAEECSTDKVLLIQYEKKSPKHKLKDNKQSSCTTQLLGIRSPASGERGEMYLYEDETCGEKQKEYSRKVEDVHPSLKEKLNSIFDELRGLSRKTEMLPDLCDLSSKRPPEPIGTDAVSVQAMPEMKSVDVQVRLSQILSQGSSLIAPHPSPMSDYKPGKLPNTDERLEEAAKNLVTYADDTEPDSTEEKIIKQESLHDEEQNSEHYKLEKLDDFDEDNILNDDKLDEKRQTEELLQEQATGSYKVTEDDDDEPAYTEKVQEDEIKKDVIPLVKSVTFDETLDIKEFSKSPEATDDGDKSPIVQDTTKDEFNFDQKERFENEIFKQKQSLEPPKDQQTKEAEVIKKRFEVPQTTDEIKDEEYHKINEKSKSDTTNSFRDSFNVVTVTDTLVKIDDDIRSYNLDVQKDAKMSFASPSKFLLERNSIRKRLNWTDDSLYLEKHLCPQLIRGLAETAVRRPTDPIAYLAHWIYKDYENREKAEQEAVLQEHRQLERTMCDVQCPEALVHKKFNVTKYPVKKEPPLISEKGTTEIAQDA